MNEELLQKIYSKYGADKGTYEQFRSDMELPEIRRKVYDKYLTGKGSYEQFESDLLGQPVQPNVQPQPEPEQEDGSFYNFLGKVPVVGKALQAGVDAWERGTNKGTDVDEGINAMIGGLSPEEGDAVFEILKRNKASVEKDKSITKKFTDDEEWSLGAAAGAWAEGVVESTAMMTRGLLDAFTDWKTASIVTGAAATGATLYGARGAATGAAVGAVTGPGAAVTSAVGGGIGGFMGGVSFAMGASSGLIEASQFYFGELQKELDARGLPLTKTNIGSVANDQEWLSKTRRDAELKGFTVGVFDTAAGVFGAKFGGSTAKLLIDQGLKARAKDFIKTGVRGGLIDSGFGVAGEAVSSNLINQPASAKELFLEANPIGPGIVTGPLSLFKDNAKIVAAKEARTAAEKTGTPITVEIKENSEKMIGVPGLIDAYKADGLDGVKTALADLATVHTPEDFDGMLRVQAQIEGLSEEEIQAINGRFVQTHAVAQKFNTPELQKDPVHTALATKTRLDVDQVDEAIAKTEELKAAGDKSLHPKRDEELAALNEQKEELEGKLSAIVAAPKLEVSDDVGFYIKELEDLETSSSAENTSLTEKEQELFTIGKQLETDIMEGSTTLPEYQNSKSKYITAFDDNPLSSQESKDPVQLKKDIKAIGNALNSPRIPDAVYQRLGNGDISAGKAFVQKAKELYTEVQELQKKLNPGYKKQVGSKKAELRSRIDTLNKAAETPTAETPAIQQEPAAITDNPALNDVESTAKALQGKDISKLSKNLGIEANWDMFGESDLLANNDPILAYTKKQLPEWDNARRKGEINSNSKITYELKKQDAKKGTTLPNGYKLPDSPEIIDRDVVFAKDEKGVIIGVAKMETLKDGKYGISHIVVAPEFRGKGVAKKLIKTLKENNSKLDLSKTKLRSKDFENSFARTIISEAYHKAKADGTNPELVKAVEDVLNQTSQVQPDVATTNDTVTEPVSDTTGDTVNRQQTPESAVDTEGVSEGVNTPPANLAEETVTQEQPLSPETTKKLQDLGKEVTMKAKTASDLYLINRRIWGLTHEQAIATAVIQDRQIAGLAKLAGISKAEMYSRIEHKKVAEAQLPTGVKLQVDAWHGSPYMFDKFSSAKIGTGEGNQSFGWGLYFTELKDIADGYAIDIAQYITNSQQIATYVMNTEPQRVIPVVSDKGLSEAIMKMTKEEQIALIESAYDEKVKKIKESKGDSDFGKHLLETQEKLRAKLIDGAKQVNPTTYKVSLHEGKTPDQYSWLEWKKQVSMDILFKIDEQAKKEGINLARENSVGDKIPFIEEQENAYRHDYSGEGVYRLLSNEIGPKNASEFLLRAGIDGVKYPTGRLGAQQEGGFNYVVFDENAVSIKEVIKFQKDANKVRGAMMVGLDGTAILYAVTDPNISTPVHELAHVFEHYITDEQKQTVLTEAGHKQWTTETSEFFARGFERYLLDGVAPTPELQSTFEKFKKWLTDIYLGIKNSVIDTPISVRMENLYASFLTDEEFHNATTRPRVFSSPDRLRGKINQAELDSLRSTVALSDIPPGQVQHIDDMIQESYEKYVTENPILEGGIYAREEKLMKDALNGLPMDPPMQLALANVINKLKQAYIRDTQTLAIAKQQGDKKGVIRSISDGIDAIRDQLDNFTRALKKARSVAGSSLGIGSHIIDFNAFDEVNLRVELGERLRESGTTLTEADRAFIKDLSDKVNKEIQDIAALDIKDQESTNKTKTIIAESQINQMKKSKMAKRTQSVKAAKANLDLILKGNIC